MLFSSIPFLYYFLPAVLILYFLAPRWLKNTVLLVSSLVFYAWGEPMYVFLMIGTIALFYGCGLAIGKCTQQKWKKFWLVLSVVVSLGLLGIFKYANFFVENFNAATGLSIPLLKLMLPVGISFYTFQCLSYTIDVYRGNAQVQKNPISFGAYVVLFPQLIAGPIVRYVDVARELDNRTHSWDEIAQGLRRFIIGLSKKIILADNLALLMKIFRLSSDKSLLFYWIYAIAFTLYIYFDFSGYSDMAIGLGRVFGFKFIENFDHPYMSRSVTEFWRRWHMSLGSWFRDYVYIPLGGNRVSKWRWVLNIFAVWMFTGFWHGADWTYILWGLMFGILLLVEKGLNFTKKAPKVLGHIWTLFWVILSFVLFSGDNSAGTILEATGKVVAPITVALGDLAGMFGFAGVPFASAETWYYLRSYGPLLIVAIVGATPLVKNVACRIGQTKVGQVLEPIVVILLLLVCSAYLVDGSFSPFLYFRF